MKSEFNKKYGVSKKQAANMYRKAAKFLETHNWAKGSLENGNSFCAIGAYNKANGFKNYNGTSYKNRGRVSNLEEDVILKYFDYHGDLVDFNDAFAEDKKQVVSVMRKVARALEHGGRV